METFSARISLEFAAAENASASSGVAPMPEWADISREQQNMILKLDLAVNQSSVLASLEHQKLLRRLRPNPSIAIGS
jgi:hypothetical protein